MSKFKCGIKIVLVLAENETEYENQACAPPLKSSSVFYYCFRSEGFFMIRATHCMLKLRQNIVVENIFYTY